MPTSSAIRRQQSTEALLSFQYQGNTGIHLERIMLKRRGSQPLLYLAGGCDWSATANRDGGGNKLMENYPKDAGYACIALTAPGSAEEGGFFLIDFSADGKTATLYLDSPIASMNGKHNKGFNGRIELGPDDRVFRLQRTRCRCLHRSRKGVARFAREGVSLSHQFPHRAIEPSSVSGYIRPLISCCIMRIDWV